MRLLRPRFKFGVKLHAYKKVVFGNFNRFDNTVKRQACYAHARVFNAFAEVGVEPVSVAVTPAYSVRAAFGDEHLAVLEWD